MMSAPASAAWRTRSSARRRLTAGSGAHCIWIRPNVKGLASLIGGPRKGRSCRPRPQSVRGHSRREGVSMKANAVRLLEERGVPHELRAYDVDPDDLTAGTVARKIGLPAE